MILSKQFLNEQVEKKSLNENFSYGGLFYNNVRPKLKGFTIGARIIIEVMAAGGDE